MLSEFVLTIKGHYIPWVLTILGLGMMLRPYKSSGWFDIFGIFRLFWLIPVFAVWAIYFAIGYYTK